MTRERSVDNFTIDSCTKAKDQLEDQEPSNLIEENEKKNLVFIMQ